MYVVEFQGQFYGPFNTEDECYSFAAKVSEEPNDWTIHALLRCSTPGITNA